MRTDFDDILSGLMTIGHRDGTGRKQSDQRLQTITDTCNIQPSKNTISQDFGLSVVYLKVVDTF